MLAGTEACYRDPYSSEKGEVGTIEYYKNLYEAWKKEGYYCGGIAMCLAEIYTALGYRSMTLDMSVFDSEGNIADSHVVTLMQYKDKWIVEDATFNVSYADDTGRILDVRDLKKRVEEGDTVKIIQGKRQQNCAFLCRHTIAMHMI